MTPLYSSENWTKDITNYTNNLADDDFFEVGAERQADLKETWSLTVGVKAMLDQDSMDSHQVYLGSSWKF